MDVASVLYRVHMSTGQNPNSEPTERSNSPAVISRVMASAISPNSTVKASMLPMLRDLPEDENHGDQQDKRAEFGARQDALYGCVHLFARQNVVV